MLPGRQVLGHKGRRWQVSWLMMVIVGSWHLEIKGFSPEPICSLLHLDASAPQAFYLTSCCILVSFSMSFLWQLHQITYPWNLDSAH